MKTGDEVKAFVKIGNMRKPDWIIGIYKGDNTVGHPKVEIHGKIHQVEIGKVKLWEPVKYENETFPAIDKFVEENWEELKSMVTESVNKFFPEEKVEINEENRQITVAEIFIGGGVREVTTIASIKELPCWSVMTYKTTPATRWEPEDVDEVAIAQEMSNIRAAKALIDAVWALKSDPYWESLTDARIIESVSYNGEDDY